MTYILGGILRTAARVKIEIHGARQPHKSPEGRGAGVKGLRDSV